MQDRPDYSGIKIVKGAFMATPIIVPKEGQSMETCRVVRWFKKKGDTVAAGDILCEVETEKATFDIEAPLEGSILDIFFGDDTEAPLLTPIAVIGVPGEEYEDLKPVLKDDQDLDAETRGEQKSVPAARPDKKPGISPRARKLAAEKAVDISKLEGTGPDGHIVERDILNRLSRKAEPVEGSAPEDSVKSILQAEGGFTDIPVKGIRKVIAEKMLASLKSTAQLTLHTSADASALIELRKRFKENQLRVEPGREQKGTGQTGAADITINDMIMHSTAKILANHKELNSHFLGDTIRVYGSVNLGFAVDAPGGLVVPVIRDADKKSIEQISLEAKDLINRCRENRINPADIKGGTFTVSNLGPFGIESFTPILNPPETGILGVGDIRLMPVFEEIRFEFVPHIGLSLTVNHQAVDGAQGARFLRDLSESLRNIGKEFENI
jgi:pyruvate dehydrogenase E2 component (dihydrolipoamide acetyltransferase)